MRVIIAAAGTAGHINPGIAIANKIKEEEKDSEIIFIGTTRGLENDLVQRAGYKLKTIDAYGLSAKLSIENIKKMYKTFKGLGEAKKIIKEFKPDIVIGTGGYICGATITAAHSLKIPTLLHESNAFPGKAVKMLAKKTDTILVSFKDAIPRIKNAKNIVYTGTPVKIRKKEYTKEEKTRILNELGLKGTKPIVLVFGGSQGAKKINDSIVEIIKNKKERNYQMVWATGPKQYDIIKEELEKIENDMSFDVEKYDYYPRIDFGDRKVQNVYNTGPGGTGYGFFILFLMEDGTVEYMPLAYAIANNDFRSYGKIEGAENIVDILDASAPLYGTTTLLVQKDGTAYDIGDQLMRIIEQYPDR